MNRDIQQLAAVVRDYARGWASRALVPVAYAIGVAEPVSFGFETFGTETDSRPDIAKLLAGAFDLRPTYFPTAAYGHFGRTDVELPWERLVQPYVLKSATSRSFT